MAISSVLPSISPVPVTPVTGRSSVPPVTPTESRSPESPGATTRNAERSGDRGERQSARSGSADSASAGEQGLDEAQLKELQELKARDREVRAHEQAHQAVGGQYAGAASYTYQRGPDGNQYAIGGEVSIDISPVAGDPRATIEKMRIVRAAAMAPAQPSGQDRAVAAEAMQLMLQARMELAMEEQEGQGEISARHREPGPGDRASVSDSYRAVAAMDGPASQGPAFQAVA